MRQPETETPDLTGWTQTDTGMWRQQHGAPLEIMSEDDDRWHGGSRAWRGRREKGYLMGLPA